ncbi:MAG: (Fe-S)-binding protein [Gammaproteobacteria bacterium]|nr:(Fe-S)-binding protein [Gammaproteobacteria bacterium]
MRQVDTRYFDSPEWLYWTGCAANYDARIARIVRATARILSAGGIRLRFIGELEACCGDPARRLGEEGLFQQLALRNIDTLRSSHIGRIVTHCAHCFHVLKNEYPRFAGTFQVAHHSELIACLLATKRLRIHPDTSVTATLHDSCYVGRYNRIFDAPRTILQSIYSDRVVEMPRHAWHSFCCGGGGAGYWLDPSRTKDAGMVRMTEAASVGARMVATECPFCLKMLERCAQATAADDQPLVKDIAEVVADALEDGGYASQACNSAKSIQYEDGPTT